MKLSELIAKLQNTLETEGDTEYVALCQIHGDTPKFRTDSFEEIHVLHDESEYLGGVTYLVADYTGHLVERVAS